jgi:excisionase family DNA binding protein
MMQAAEAELGRRERTRPRTLSDAEREQLLSLGSDLGCVWSAPSTTDRDRKQLLRCLIEEVIVNAAREERRVTLTVRWRGGMISELVVQLRRYQPKIRTDEDTVSLLERLAVHYDDATIAGILNRQGRLSATGERFTAQIVGGVRRYRGITRHEPSAQPADGELVTVAKTAELLGVVPSTVHRWLTEGFIAGEQDTPGAPWRIRVNDELRARLVEEPPEGWLTVAEARHALGVSRQTVLQRVKHGELKAVHVRNGRQKGLRIQVISSDAPLFDITPMSTSAV